MGYWSKPVEEYQVVTTRRVFKAPSQLMEDLHEGDGATPPHIREERQYRKGIQHGAQLCLNAVQNGALWPALYDWVHVALYRYRLNDIDRVVLPPRPPVPSKLSDPAGDATRRAA
jgi:hypothetical protein